MSLEINRATKCGYNDCIEIKNTSVSIVIEPKCGGRIIEYALNGKNILYVNPKEDGYLLESGNTFGPFSPSGGRCDIGPEMTTPAHPTLWLGQWDVVHADELGVIIQSKKDPVTGLQLERFFKLAEKTSHLTFTQTVRNLSEEPITCFHWSRTLAVGGGIAIAPVNPQSRYPKGYLLYGDGSVMNYMPAEEPNICITNNCLMITGEPSRAKFALDVAVGWLAYAAKNDLLFVKKFHVYPGRVYGEMAANNVSIWYYKNEMCEIEPIGPKELLEPGDEFSFTEEWWLLPWNFEHLKNKKNPDDVIDIIKAL